MSHPADYIKIRNNKVTVTRDRYGALGVLYNFLSPEEAEEFSMIGDQTDALDVCAEGGFLIDFDRQNAIVFGGTYQDMPDEPSVKLVNEAFAKGMEAYLKLVSDRWLGWDIQTGDGHKWLEYLETHSIKHSIPKMATDEEILHAALVAMGIRKKKD